MIVTALLVLATASAAPVHADEAPKSCSNCAGWNAPRAPFKIHGNTYYVGTGGLSAVLVT
jgi:metallo-beta-lactamase class B